MHAQVPHVAATVALVHDVSVGPSKWTSTAAARVDKNFVATIQHAPLLEAALAETGHSVDTPLLEAALARSARRGMGGGCRGVAS